MVTSQANIERINLRVKSAAKSLLERAAQFEGKTLTNFILNSAIAKAEKTIVEHEMINLNVRESEAFYDALSRPVKFNKKLLAALEQHDKRVDQQ